MKGSCTWKEKTAFAVGAGTFGACHRGWTYKASLFASPLDGCGHTV